MADRGVVLMGGAGRATFRFSAASRSAGARRLTLPRVSAHGVFRTIWLPFLMWATATSNTLPSPGTYSPYCPDSDLQAPEHRTVLAEGRTETWGVRESCASPLPCPREIKTCPFSSLELLRFCSPLEWLLDLEGNEDHA